MLDLSPRTTTIVHLRRKRGFWSAPQMPAIPIAAALASIIAMGILAMAWLVPDDLWEVFLGLLLIKIATIWVVFSWLAQLKGEADRVAACVQGSEEMALAFHHPDWDYDRGEWVRSTAVAEPSRARPSSPRSTA